VTVLLLDVRVEIDAEREHALNEWYYTHVPRLVSVPGYESGRRYVALTDGPKYAALYEIPNVKALPSLLGADHERRHPLTLAEWNEWDARFVPYMRHGSTNLYEAQTDFPLLVGDHPIVEVRFDREGRAGAQREDTLLSRVGEADGVVAATILRAAREESVRWLNSEPSGLLLVQMQDEEKAIELVSSGLSAGIARGADVETLAYAQIARHWPFMKEVPNGD
jgi:hypothetical protein